MSGIAGIVYFDGRPVSSEKIGGMANALAPRGPDGINVYRSGQVGLAHCMLHTTPESLTEQLPFHDSEARLVITADARIDNRDELSEMLGLAHAQSKAMSDSQFILTAYKKWGEECAVKLIGDFAFAIWDEKEQKMFCARDHMGVKPFFYYGNESFVVFASELKALFSLKDVPRYINEIRVADFLQRIVDNNSYTFFENVLRLEPATNLITSSQGFAIRKYWQLDMSKTIRRRNNLEYAEEFKEIFFEAVSCRLRSAFPVGCLFSGGLDSSSIACVTRELYKGKYDLSAFSFFFPELPPDELSKTDEREYQQTVVELGGINQYQINGSNKPPLGKLQQQLLLTSEPFFYPHLYVNREAYKLAQENNIRVLLNGMDGDSVVSHGYELIQHLFLHGRFVKLFKEYRAMQRRQKVENAFRRCIFNPYFRKPVSHLWHIYKQHKRPGWNLDKLINLDFAIKSALPERTVPELVSFESAKSLHLRRLTNELHASTLETINCFVSSFSIENRSPFYDRRLMEFCLALPSCQKLQNGWSRFILRESMKDILPNKVRMRVDKSNLSYGFQRNLLKCHEFELDRLVSKPHFFLQDKINRPVLKSYWDSFRSDPVNSPYICHLNLYDVALLHSWLGQLLG